MKVFPWDQEELKKESQQTPKPPSFFLQAPASHLSLTIPGLSPIPIMDRNEQQEKIEWKAPRGLRRGGLAACYLGV